MVYSVFLFVLLFYFRRRVGLNIFQKILVLTRFPPAITTTSSVVNTLVVTSKRWNSSSATTTTTTTTGSSPSSRLGYRSPTPPTGVPLSRLFSNTFPLSYSESYAQWLKRDDLQEAENEVLSCLPFYPQPDSTRRAKSLKVPIGEDRYINEFEITRTVKSETVTDDVVVLHGYGAGLGFMYKIFDEISKEPGSRIHGLDLLGYGGSSRPTFRLEKTRSSKDLLAQTLEAEDFFIDALEAWRKSKGLETFSMVAHSLGAYLGASYSVKYPGRLNKLMLVSPAGVTRSSYAIDKVPSENSDVKAKAPWWFHFLWECNVSPFSLVRNTGPLGPRFVSGWSSRRFAKLSSEESRALHMYAYCIFNAPGSGEYALNYLLAPGAYGRRPLADRAEEIPCPTYWLYGDKDWMDIRGGLHACDRIKGNCEIATVSNSGHHIYLDNPSELNRHIRNFMKSM